MDVLLVVNAGSSSLKFQSFGLDGGMHLRVRGQVDGIGTRPRFKAVDSGGATLIESTHSPEQVPDLPAAIAVTRDWLATRQGVEIRAIGHRVVHGGPDHDRPVLIDEAVLAQLARYQTLAPLHQPNNLAPIRLAMQIAPDVPQVACFDTGFHHGHADHVACYAMPRAYFEQGIRRYGFHGLSYEYIAKRLPEVVPELAQGRIIVAHLGSGASMCALQGGRSIETTMGFTALDGLPMGTRPGQLDPGVVLHLIQNEGMTASDVSDMLYHGAGLRGLSGISSDMRDLLASADPNAAFAVDHFIYRCGLQAGQLAAALGGIDGFVFTAGIGEHSPEIRARIVEGLGWLGARLDPAANEAGGPCISSSASRFPVLVIPTDEELMIAHHTLALIGGAA